ncbi:hypothetical protein AB1E18_000518 [Capra hircus]
MNLSSLKTETSSLWLTRTWALPDDLPGGSSTRKLWRNEKKLKKVKVNLAKINKELETVCNAMLALLDKFLMRNRSDFQCESKVFSLEMKGDSYRYLAGAGSGEKKNDVVPNSALCGKEASAISQERLQPTHPIRLGQASLYAEIQKDRRQASLLAFHATETTHIYSPLSREAVLDKFIGIALSPWKLPFPIVQTARLLILTQLPRSGLFHSVSLNRADA